MAQIRICAGVCSSILYHVCIDSSGDNHGKQGQQREREYGGTPWDADNSAGNDSGPSNGIVRSFDMLSYTVTVRNAVRE